jgi:hypothetical protein
LPHSPIPRSPHAWGSCRHALPKGLLLAVMSFLSGANVYAQTIAAQHIVVRSYNTIGLPLSMLDRAESTVAELLHEAGIDGSWRNCRTTNGPSSQSTDLCADVLNASEVIVRIVRTPRAITDVEVLGYSHVDVYQRHGTLATVFADRVRTLATGLRVDQGTLLGRAITHEVGHLLLGTLDHSDTGLMRGTWNTVSRHGFDWLFSSAEATRMRAGLEARTLSPLLAVARASRDKQSPQ